MRLLEAHRAGRPFPVSEVDGRVRSPHVIEVPARLVSERGAPLYLRSDNGPEFVPRALLKWIVDQGIGTALIDRRCGASLLR